MSKLINLKYLICLCILFSTFSYVYAEEAQDGSLPRKEMVFDNGNSEVPYRIPAIAQTRNGDLIAVADYRHSGQDIGMVENGRVDLRVCLKPFNSGKWGDVRTLAATIENENEFIAFGDPAIVADRESDAVLVTSCSGNVSFPKGTHENHQGWARFISEDGGKTWSGFTDLSPQVFDVLDAGIYGPIKSFFIGSGKITQSHTIKEGDFFRLYCAALVKDSKGKKINFVFYSDDFGENWKLLGDNNESPIPQDGDEPKVEELPDGRILISSRTKGGRVFNIFRYDDISNGKGSWDCPAKSSIENQGVMASSNACNGEILVVPSLRRRDNEKTYLLLQSVPMNTEGLRANVGINYKDLGNLPEGYTPEQLAANWEGRFEVTPETSAYSTMILDRDGEISFLFEENISNGGYDIVYRKLTLEEITDGEYSIHDFGFSDAIYGN